MSKYIWKSIDTLPTFVKDKEYSVLLKAEHDDIRLVFWSDKIQGFCNGKDYVCV